MVELTEFLHRKPAELSGGQRQRVALARAIVREPTVFLMDEPLSNLDAKLRVSTRAQIKNLQHSLKTTTIYVTHDQIEAMTMATHVGVLQDGKLVQFGSPREIYEDPNSVYVASRLGLPRINILPADLFESMASNSGTIGLRPEHIAYGKGEPATVKRVEQLGDQTRLHLDFKGHAITALSPDGNPFAVGSTVKIQPENPLCFDDQGNRVAGSIA